MAASRSTLLARTRRTTAEPDELPARPAGVQLRARRSPRLVVIGLLCACLGALVMGWAWNAQSHSQSVLMVTRDISRGELIKPTDLATTTLTGGSGVAVVPADQASALVGQYALGGLTSGALLAPGQIGAQAVPAGSAQLGLRLTAGRLPSQPMPPGARVRLVAVPGGAADAAAAESTVEFDAVVVSSPQQTTDGAWVFDVQIADQLASQVAALAAGDRLVVVRKADG